MRRRDFVAGFSAGLLCARGTSAQPALRRVGILMGIGENDYSRSLLNEVLEGLRAFGWVPGNNLQVEIRWSRGDTARATALAKELVAFSPEVLLAHTDFSVVALRRESSSVPLVFLTVSDPIGLGFVTSLANPGTNNTGFINYEPALGGKWLDILTEAVPAVARVGVAYNPQVAPRAEALYVDSLRQRAAARRIEVLSRQIADPAEVEALVADLGIGPRGGLVVIPDNSITGRNPWLVALTNQHRVPTVHPYPYFPTAGGLMSYGIDPVDSFRKAPSYIDRMLRGAKPQALPVQMPAKFRLVLNLKTAKALELDIPASVVTQADEVLE